MNGVEVVSQAGETQLAFGPVLDVSSARALYHTLNSVLATATPLALDAGRVERIDTAALQLLATFCHRARADGLRLRWHAASAAFRDAAALLGVDDTLGTPR